MQFPLILARDIPVGAPTLSADDTIPIIRSNGKTERIDAKAFASLSPKFQSTTPTSPIVPGESGAIAWDQDGVFTYCEGMWGKTPRVYSHWEELDQNSRFLLVNKEQPLLDSEIANVRNSIKLFDATTNQKGLVKLATAIDANDGGVLTGPQVIDYIRTQLDSLVPEASSNANLGNYTGDVLIKGPDGEVLITYNSENKTLYLGSADVNVVLRGQSHVQVQDADASSVVTIQS